MSISTIDYSMLANAAYSGIAEENIKNGKDDGVYPLPLGWSVLTLNQDSQDNPGPMITSQSWASLELPMTNPGTIGNLATKIDPTLGGFSATAYVNSATMQIVVSIRGSSTGNALLTTTPATTQLSTDAQADWAHNNILFFADDMPGSSSPSGPTASLLNSSATMASMFTALTIAVSISALTSAIKGGVASVSALLGTSTALSVLGEFGMSAAAIPALADVFVSSGSVTGALSTLYGGEAQAVLPGGTTNALIPPQINPAVQFTAWVVQNYAPQGYTITLTGHSLGAALASTVGSLLHIDTTVFDALPTANVIGVLTANGIPSSDLSYITSAGGGGTSLSAITTASIASIVGSRPAAIVSNNYIDEEMAHAYGSFTNGNIEYYGDQLDINIGNGFSSRFLHAIDFQEMLQAANNPSVGGIFGSKLVPDPSTDFFARAAEVL